MTMSDNRRRARKAVGWALGVLEEHPRAPLGRRIHARSVLLGIAADVDQLANENARLREWIAASSVAMQARHAGIITPEEYGEAQRRRFQGDAPAVTGLS